MTEEEMVGWHHGHNGHGFGWTLGVGDGQGGLACCVCELKQLELTLKGQKQYNSQRNREGKMGWQRYSNFNQFKRRQDSQEEKNQKFKTKRKYMIQCQK